MTFYVLDTNIISLLLRGDPVVTARFRSSLIPENLVIACPLVWYEIRRGLLKRDARRQTSHFEELFQTFIWQDYTIADWTLATELWAIRQTQGLPIADADLLIAVFARKRSAILATNNESDFQALGVRIENWTKPVENK